MSSPFPSLRFEVDGSGTWPVLELVKKTPAPRSIPVTPIANPDGYDLVWREDGGVLYMDAFPRSTTILEPSGPVEVELVVAASVHEMYALAERATFPFTLRMHEGAAESIMEGRAIVVGLECACPPALGFMAPCHRSRLLFTVAE